MNPSNPTIQLPCGSVGIKKMTDKSNQVRLDRLKSQARKGDAELAWVIGEGYLDGRICIPGEVLPVRKNRKVAEYWLRIASEQGNADAMLELSSVITTYGEPRWKEAFAWEVKAMELGASFAEYDAAITASALGRRKVAYRLLTASFPKHPGETSLLLGICLYAGYGCHRDLEQAQRYFLRAAASCANLDKDRVDALFFVNAIRHGVSFSVEKHIGIARPKKIFDQDSASLFKRLSRNPALSSPAKQALAETLDSEAWQRQSRCQLRSGEAEKRGG